MSINKIEQVLSVNDIYSNSYNYLVKTGEQFLSSKHVVFLCLIRDCESVFDTNITKIINFAKKYTKDFDIVLFENDSIDNTKIKLQEIKNKYTNIHYISRNYNREKFGPVKNKNRTIALAEYRNELKNYIQTNIKNIDYIIVIDFDFLDFSENGILNSFGWIKENPNIGGMAGNSFQMTHIFNQTSIWNYDSWAFRRDGWNDWCYFKTSDYQNYSQMLWFGLWIPPLGSNPIQVNSAFGGMCIYRSDYYYSGHYDGIDCEHVTFHHSLYQNNKNFELFLNPSQVMLFN